MLHPERVANNIAYQRTLTFERYDADGAANYFSIDGGVTTINTFNTVCCGDLSDWSGATFDAYNAFLTRGQALLTSPGDLTLMDALGYHRVATEPRAGYMAASRFWIGWVGDQPKDLAALIG